MNILSTSPDTLLSDISDISKYFHSQLLSPASTKPLSISFVLVIGNELWDWFPTKTKEVRWKLCLTINSKWLSTWKLTAINLWKSKSFVICKSQIFKPNDFTLHPVMIQLNIDIFGKSNHTFIHMDKSFECWLLTWEYLSARSNPRIYEVDRSGSDISANHWTMSLKLPRELMLMSWMALWPSLYFHLQLSCQTIQTFPNSVTTSE